jgi:hypothetical protein
VKGQRTIKRLGSELNLSHHQKEELKARRMRNNPPAKSTCCLRPKYVLSPSFRSASLVQSLWSSLNFKGHYFGGDENNVRYTAGSWTFHGEHWRLTWGFGVAFGDDGFQTMPALSIRWNYERRWFITEGLFPRPAPHHFPEGTEPEPGEPASKSVVPSIADGNHVSARWKRLIVGGTWEHMQFREGKEWEGGVRVAYRVWAPLSLTFFLWGRAAKFEEASCFNQKKRSNAWLCGKTAIAYSCPTKRNCIQVAKVAEADLVSL